MGKNETAFRNLLKANGVSKCFISPNFEFETEYPDGRLYIDTSDELLLCEVLKLFTNDDCISDENQCIYIESLSKSIDTANYFI